MINVKNLKKSYMVYQKNPGVMGSLTSFLNRKYYEIFAVDDISFEIKESELVGFIGPNGAGKTTTLKVLSGLLYPTSGEVKVLGYKPSDRKPELQKQFSLIMGQKNQLWWDLPLWEALLLNKAIYEISDNKFKKTADELIEVLGLKDILHIQVRKLSLGQRMKAELLASLIHTPKLLFLDEPTLGLDVVAQKKMRDFIKEYNTRYNATVLLTSHYMEDVKELCNRIIMIDKGKILYDGALDKLVNQYATEKVIHVDFENKVNKEKLEKIGAVKEFNELNATIYIPRETTVQSSTQLLQNFPIKDFVVEEQPVEDIIRRIFNTTQEKIN